MPRTMHAVNILANLIFTQTCEAGDVMSFINDETET